MAHDSLAYVDFPPAGYQVAPAERVIAKGDMVLFDVMSKNGGWKEPSDDQKVIGATPRDLWPRVLAVAVPAAVAQSAASHIH
jgi:hypothetical protein